MRHGLTPGQNDPTQNHRRANHEENAMSDEKLQRVRAVCLALPETNERPSHGAPTFFVRDKRAFVMYMDNHHEDGRLALWCAAPPGEQQTLQAMAPEWFFVPPYVGVRGWIG